MKKKISQGLKWGIPLVLLMGILITRNNSTCGEWYARNVYPVIAEKLSFFSSWFSFPVGDVFIVGAFLWLIVYPVYASKKKKRTGETIGKIVRFLIWIYIWFYVAWGINYFRASFFERTGIDKNVYSPEVFKQFLEDYTNGLINSYDSVDIQRGTACCLQLHAKNESVLERGVEEEITRCYQLIAEKYGFIRPFRVLFPKTMLWSKGMSMVGVTGYMGPFFSEFHLNGEIQPIGYPFTYAHELAHRLGIAGEAEANLYAYLATTCSSVREIRFSGYLAVLGYVMNNAKHLLTEEEYNQIIHTIPTGILEIYNAHLAYWRAKYNPFIGKIQHKIYHAFLKGNKISSGTKNYSEVVGLMIAVWSEKNESIKSKLIPEN